MKAKIIAIKNITDNTLLVGTQLEWNLWLKVTYIFESPTMIMQGSENKILSQSLNFMMFLMLFLYELCSTQILNNN